MQLQNTLKDITIIINYDIIKTYFFSNIRILTFMFGLFKVLSMKSQDRASVQSSTAAQTLRQNQTDTTSAQVFKFL